jgi:hypothetical protein
MAWPHQMSSSSNPSQATGPRASAAFFLHQDLAPEQARRDTEPGEQCLLLTSKREGSLSAQVPAPHPMHTHQTHTTQHVPHTSHTLLNTPHTCTHHIQHNTHMTSHSICTTNNMHTTLHTLTSHMHTTYVNIPHVSHQPRTHSPSTLQHTWTPQPLHHVLAP